MNDEHYRGAVHRSSFIVPRLVLALVFTTCAKHLAHPNVLLITLDTFRADRIGALTPNLSRFAAGAVTFANADAAVPLTLPSHATLLSGLLPLHHGLRNNGAGAMSRDTIANAFSKSGYRTGAFVSAFVLDHRFGLNRGFETYDDEVARDPNDAAGTFDAERRGGATVDRALQWLRKADARPWFAWVHLYDAHAPYAPPPPLPQTYDGEIAYVDQQVGRLLAAVDRTKTVIVIVGDHGEALGEHGELTHGLLLYEPTLHVPLMIVAPDVAARRVNEPVSTADVAPTIASLAGVALTAADGRDISRKAEPESIYAESEYPATFGWSPLSSLRDGDRKLITGARPELFHLPDESANLLATDRRSYTDLLRRLTNLRTSATAATTTAIDAETRSKLASLGYIAPTGAKAGGRDPRDVVNLFTAFEKASAQDDLAALDALVKADPGNSVFRSALAKAYRERGDYARALPLYRDAVALAPRDGDAWYNLAAALQGSGHGAEGMKAAGEAERLDPNRADIYNVTGILRIGNGDPNAAERDFRHAIALDPRNARAYNNLGNVLRITGRFADAAAAYQHALTIAPRYPDAINGLGVLDVQNGRAADAIRLFDAALQLSPQLYEASLNRAIALQISGDHRAARTALNALLRQLPKDPRYDAERGAATTLLSRLQTLPSPR